MTRKINKEFERKIFKKGTSGNPKGRPKKFVSQVLSELLKKGEKVTKNTIVDIYQVMISLTKDDLLSIAKDERKPFIYRVVAKEMLGKRGFDVIEIMLNRANGKPTEIKEIEHAGGVQIKKVVFNSNNMNPIESESDIKDHLDNGDI